MTDLQQRLLQALADAGARGIDSYVFGEAGVRSVCVRLSNMVKAGLAHSYEPKNKARRWFATAALMQEHQQAAVQAKHPYRKGKPGRPSLQVMRWAPDAEVIVPPHVVVEYGDAPRLGLRTNTHRNGL